MKKRLFVSLIFIFICFLIQGSQVTEAQVHDKNVIINGENEYENINDIPTTIYYREGNYEGTLKLKDKVVSSGSDSKELNYDTGYWDFSVRDYCEWSSEDYIMYFQYNKGWPPSSKYVEMEGYTFQVWLSSVWQGTYFTCYATPDQPRGEDKYEDDSWIGPGGCSNGTTYHTATHYYIGKYSGSYVTPDTRKYKGVYEGTLYEIPGVVSNKVKIEGNVYKSNNTNWIKQNESFDVVIGGYTSFTSSAFKINSLHPLIYGEGATYINGYIANYQDYSTTGGVSTNENPYLNFTKVATSRNNNNNTESRFSINLNQDSKKITIYPLLRVYRNGEYTNDSQIVANNPWKEEGKQIDVMSDGVAPSIDIINANNDWFGHDVEVGLLAKDYGSGVQNIELWKNKLLIARRTGNFSYVERNEGINILKVVSADNVGNSREKTFTVKLDKTAPTIKNYTAIVNNDNYTLKVAANIDDHLSGVNPSSVKVEIVSLEDKNKRILVNLNQTSSNKYESTINLQQGLIYNVYGNMEVNLYAEDNVGNGNGEVLASQIFLKGRSDLVIDSMEVVDKDNRPLSNIIQNEDYRIKFVISNKDKLKSKICNLSLTNIKNNTVIDNIEVREIMPMQTIELYSSSIDSSKLGSYQLEGFVDSNNTVIESNENNNTKRVAYTVFPKNNKPIAKFEVTPKIEDRDRTLTYKDLSYDNDDWDEIVEWQWKWSRTKDEAGNKVLEEVKQGNNPPSSFNVYGTYDIQLRVRDRGNPASSYLWSEWYSQKVEIKNLISVRAEIIPLQAMQGQLVKLKIITTYSPNKLIINFPNELIEKSKSNIQIDINCDNIIDEKDKNLIEASLNSRPGEGKWNQKYDLNMDGVIDELDVKIIEINYGKEIKSYDVLNNVELNILTQDEELLTEYEFFLPTNTELTLDKNSKRIKDKYRFDVKAIRDIDGEEANTYVDLDVQGNIYNGLRTRMK